MFRDFPEKDPVIEAFLLLSFRLVVVVELWVL